MPMRIQYNMSLITRKPVFGIWNQVRPKPICLATKTSQNIETLHVASFAFLILYFAFLRANNKGSDQTVWMGRLVYTIIFLHASKSVFFLISMYKSPLKLI